jgi:hypothetical protein
MMFEQTIESVLNQIGMNAQDLHKHRWESLEKLVKRSRIKCADKEALKRFYEDKVSTMETVEI